MSMAPSALPRKLVKRVRGLDVSQAIELASRLGYAARGLVYLGLGSIVLMAALDLTPRAKGAKGLDGRLFTLGTDDQTNGAR